MDIGNDTCFEKHHLKQKLSFSSTMGSSRMGVEEEGLGDYGGDASGEEATWRW